MKHLLLARWPFGQIFHLSLMQAYSPVCRTQSLSEKSEPTISISLCTSQLVDHAAPLCFISNSFSLSVVLNVTNNDSMCK